MSCWRPPLSRMGYHQSNEAARYLKAKFFASTYAAIKKFMAGRTQNPNHMGLGVLNETPCAISLKFRPMRDFEDTIFPARFASFWHIRISSFQSIKRCIFGISFSLVNRAPFFVFTTRPYFPQIARGFYRTLRRTISLIGIWGADREKGTALAAIATIFCRSLMLFPANTSGALGAIITAPFFIRATRLKGFGTLRAKQIIHCRTITS